MKKVIAFLICGVAIAFVAISVNAGAQVALGKVYPGMTESELIKVYGEPVNRYGDDWQYQDFMAEVEHGVVEKVTTRSGAIATPDGIHVGQSVAELESVCGRADKVDYDDGAVEYKYYSGFKKVEFQAVNNVIVKITCKIND